MSENKSHKYFLGTKGFTHEHQPKVGILLVNLGTPDAPTPKAVRVYLRQFLSDPRIIELPKILWRILLNTVILATRPKKVSKLYKSIWTAKGSPLLVYANSLREKLTVKLSEKVASPFCIEVGMRIGNPSVGSALRKLKDQQCEKIIIVPLFAQYSSTTVGSAYDAIFDELKTWRWVPDIRTLNCFHDNPHYLNALAEGVRNHWNRNGKAQKLLMSFHGVPKRYVEAGDPYHCHCHKTGRLLAEILDLNSDEYIVAFQSQFGREEWIKPATAQTMEDLAKAGLESVDVICPGFLADCLETIEEIEVENRDIFLSNGGKDFKYIPALNDSDRFVMSLSEMILEQSVGWMFGGHQWDKREYSRHSVETESRFKKHCPYHVDDDLSVGIENKRSLSCERKRG